MSMAVACNCRDEGATNNATSHIPHEPPNKVWQSHGIELWLFEDNPYIYSGSIFKV